MELLIETSSREGLCGLARDGRLRQQARLDANRRHARDLAAAVRRVLDAEGLHPADCTSVIVSLGPGSFTGLRVGLASAKAFAFATGCSLIAVPTFQAIAALLPHHPPTVEIMADGLQGWVYAERFQAPAPGTGQAPAPRTGGAWRSVKPLALLRLADWLERLQQGGAATEPGLVMPKPGLAATEPDVGVKEQGMTVTERGGAATESGVGVRGACVGVTEPGQAVKESLIAVTGPGVALHAAVLPPNVLVLDAAFGQPTLEGLLRAAAYVPPCSRGEMFNIEPLYLRGSSAEEKRKLNP